MVSATQPSACSKAAHGSDSYRYDPNGLTYDLDVLPLEPPLDLRELEGQPGVLTWTGEQGSVCVLT